jgi:hypothetical protein
MARQGFDLQLTRYDERGWRANVLHDGDGTLADERDQHPLGEDLRHARRSARRRW